MATPRNINPQVAHARALLAGRVRGGQRPDQIEEARVQLVEANAVARAEVLAASWPDLSDAARDRVTRIIGLADGS